MLQELLDGRDITPEQEQLILQTLVKAQSNLVDFRKIMLTTDDDECGSAPFHYQWSDTLLHGTKNTAFEGFRESAKSQYVLRAFPLYCIAFPSKERDYIGLVKANTKLAGAKLREIQSEFHSIPILQKRLVKIREESAEVFSLDLLDHRGNVINIRIEAYGKHGAIRGMAHGTRRPKIVIIDDPQDTEDARSETIMEDDWDWFLSDVKFLGRKTRIFLIGNNLGEKAILERVDCYKEELKYDFYRIPVMYENENGIMVPAWPEKDTIEDILEEKEAFRNMGKLSVWYREKMCEAIADETRMFRREDFQTYVTADAERIASRCNVYIRMDPAFSKNDTADYTAIVVAGIDADGVWYILDIPYGRWDLAEKTKVLFDTVRKWKPINVGIESVGGQKLLIEHIKAERGRRNCFFSVEELKTGGKQKEQRIACLQPLYKEQKVWHPQEAPWLLELESELLMFAMDGAKSLHDDLIDALAYILQNTDKPFNASNNTRMAQSLAQLPRKAKMTCRVA